MVTMPLDRVLSGWRPGSYDPPWSWQDESDDLWGTDTPLCDDLANSIIANGVLEPVLLGNDGRVWDGHHRIVVAMMLAIPELPVEVVSEGVGHSQADRAPSDTAQSVRDAVDAAEGWRPVPQWPESRG